MSNPPATDTGVHPLERAERWRNNELVPCDYRFQRLLADGIGVEQNVIKVDVADRIDATRRSQGGITLQVAKRTGSRARNCSAMGQG